MAGETAIESMVYRLIGDGSSYFQMLQQAERQTAQSTAVINQSYKGVTQSVKQSYDAVANYGNKILGNVTNFVTSVKGQLLGLVGLGSLIAAGMKGFSLAKESEDAFTQFSTMLNSADKAKELMSSIESFAAKTPLVTAGLTQAAKTLLQFNVSGENIMPLMKMIGNATGGDNDRFQRMSLAFGQMNAAGRLMGQDLLQMINAGFNPLQQISITTGKSMAQLKQTMEQGGITVQMVAQAFENASKKGGLFEGLMDKQSKTLGGLWSTLIDNIQIQLKRLTFFVVDATNLRAVIKNVSDFVERSQPLIEGWAKYFIRRGQMIYDYLAPIFKKVYSVVSEAVTYITHLWDSMSGSLQLTIAIATAVVIAIGPVVAGISFLLSSVPVVTAAIVAALTGLIMYFGGIEKVAQNTWQFLTDTYTFMEPIFAALIELGAGVWEVLSEGAMTAFNTIQEYVGPWFNWMSTSFTDLYNTIQSTIIEAIYMTEFVLRNFGTFAQVILLNVGAGVIGLGLKWLGFQLDLSHILTVKIPAYVRWFAANFFELIRIGIDKVGIYFDNWGNNISRLTQQIWKKIKTGGMSEWEFEWKKADFSSIIDQVDQLPKIAERSQTAIEDTMNTTKKGLEQASQTLTDSLGEDYNKFLEGKNKKPVKVAADGPILGPIKNSFKDAEDAAEKAGLNMGNSLAQGVKHGTDQMGTAIVGSSKYFDKLYDYTQGIQGQLEAGALLSMNPTKKKVSKKKYNPKTDDEFDNPDYDVDLSVLDSLDNGFVGPKVNKFDFGDKKTKTPAQVKAAAALARLQKEIQAKDDQQQIAFNTSTKGEFVAKEDKKLSEGEKVAKMEEYLRRLVELTEAKQSITGTQIVLEGADL